MPRLRRDANAAHDILELPNEGFDDARDLVRHALKRGDHWQARHGLTSVAESYARGDCDIHLHLRFNKLHSGKIEAIDTSLARLVRWWLRNPTDLCIRAQRHPAVEVNMPSETTEGHGYCSRSQNCDEAVFVGIVQLVKKYKGAVPTPVPSLVWLKSLEACPKVARDTLETSPPLHLLAGVESGVSPISDFLGETFVEADWETGVERRRIRPQEGNLPCEAVEGRTQVVRDLPDHHRPIDWEFLRPTLDSKRVIASLRLMLGFADFIEVVPEEPLNALLESYDLAVCPLDLGSWPIQRMHDACARHP